MVSADYIEKKNKLGRGGGARGRASDPRIYIFIVSIYFLFLKTNLIENFYIVGRFNFFFKQKGP